MLLLAQSEIVLLLRDEERFRQADGIVRWMEGIAGPPPSLGCEERVGIHYCGVAQRIALWMMSFWIFDKFLIEASKMSHNLSVAYVSSRSLVASHFTKPFPTVKICQIPQILLQLCILS
jgi:hypothetical protein